LAKTKANTNWFANIWQEWSAYHQKLTPEESTAGYPLDTDIATMEIGYWLQRFVLEVRKSNKNHYFPDSLYQLISGLQQY